MNHSLPLDPRTGPTVPWAAQKVGLAIWTLSSIRRKTIETGVGCGGSQLGSQRCRFPASPLLSGVVVESHCQTEAQAMICQMQDLKIFTLSLKFRFPDGKYFVSWVFCFLCLETDFQEMVSSAFSSGDLKGVVSEHRHWHALAGTPSRTCVNMLKDIQKDTPSRCSLRDHPTHLCALLSRLLKGKANFSFWVSFG